MRTSSFYNNIIFNAIIFEDQIQDQKVLPMFWPLFSMIEGVGYQGV